LAKKWSLVGQLLDQKLGKETITTFKTTVWEDNVGALTLAKKWSLVGQLLDQSFMQ